MLRLGGITRQFQVTPADPNRLQALWHPGQAGSGGGTREGANNESSGRLLEFGRGTEYMVRRAGVYAGCWRILKTINR